MTSVIIPAHNEEAVIGRTLESLFASIGESEAEVVVVCNACTDRTAEIARRASPRVTVLGTSQRGKCAAINLGERHVQTFPRIYLDADISVSRSFFADLERVLLSGNAKAAWPNVKYDLSQSSWPVSAFYRVWTALPYNKPGRIGVGAYSLSEAGRSHFGQFPNIISDDGFVRGLFAAEERAVSNTCHTIVLPPRDLKSLIAVRTRSRVGVYELRRKHPEIMRGHRAAHELTASDYMGCLRPGVLLLSPVYLTVVLFTKFLAFWRLREKNGRMTWDRDLSQRPES